MYFSAQFLALAGALTTSQPAAHPCATPAQSAQVAEYFKGRPGAPLPIPGRVLKVEEAIVTSGLPRSQSWGIASSPEVFRKIWASIDGWGAQTRVSLVFTSGGQHAWNFPSLVPITQPDRNNGMYDMYADGGRGVHGHIMMAEVDSIWAVDIKRDKDQTKTQAIIFYDAKGKMILSVYASVAGQEPGPDPKAMEAFEKTRDLIRAIPGICMG